MKKNKLTVIMVCAATLLASLGCLFLWNYSREEICIKNLGHLFVWQLFSNIIGIMFFAGAWALGWKRWLKAAPWLLAVWFGLMIMALTGSPINGAYRWVEIGPIRFNARTLLWPIGALFAAWLCSYCRVRPRILCSIVIGLFVFVLLETLLSAGRLARLLAYFGGKDPCGIRMFIQSQMRLAIDEAAWIGHAGRTLRYLVDPHTDSIVAAVSLVLGKWAVACAVALMGVIAACLAGFRRQITDPARRLYVLIFGGVLVFVAGWNYLQNLMLVPSFGCSFSWLGYGGTDVICAWLGLGIAVASACEHEESKSDEYRWWRPWAISLSVAGVMISALLWAPTPTGMKFREPKPEKSDLGVFGTEPVRGTILAANGEPLARSVGVWVVHIDPQAVRYSSSLSTNNVIEAVAKGLGLSQEKTREIYENKKSRYVLARKNIDETTLEWCQDGSNKWRYGLVVEYVQRRNYPLGLDAAHVTGGCQYVGRYNVSFAGVSGLEHACCSVLSGKQGKVDSEQTYEENLRTGVPTNGGVVRTTIEVPFQRAMSEVLNEAVEANQAESAWAIAVRIPKGEIVAMSAYPACDPNASGRSFEEVKALKNGAVQTLHEPGGLMKPLVYALAIDAGCVKPGEISDWTNVTFTNLCHSIGTNQMWQGFQKFSFGHKIGDGMLSGEETGIVYQPKRWSSVSLDCFGMGQGFAVTGIQLAQAYATLANGGVRVTPYLVESMQDVDGKDVWTHKIKAEERIVSAEAADAVAKLMLSETNAVAFVAGTPVPGKATTFALVKENWRECLGDEPSKYSFTDFDALYAGFFPVEKPEYAVVVGFRKPKPEHASEKVALPVFERIADEIMENRSGAK